IVNASLLHPISPSPTNPGVTFSLTASFSAALLTHPAGFPTLLSNDCLLSDTILNCDSFPDECVEQEEEVEVRIDPPTAPRSTLTSVRASASWAVDLERLKSCKRSKSQYPSSSHLIHSSNSEDERTHIPQ